MNEEILSFVTVGPQAPRKRGFRWATERVRYYNGQVQSNQLLDRPIRFWSMPWEWLTTTSRSKMIELFNRASGMTRTFLLKDWIDYLCTLTDWSFTAVGGETTTQLGKSYYVGETETWTEDKTRIVPSTIYAPTVKIDAAVKTEGTHFTLDDSTGIINWAAGTSPNGALTIGQVVTADYQFYFPVQFDFDEMVESEHQHGFYAIDNGIELIEVVE
jgi:uncharacterized protein (TIGR02217 family)